MTIVVLRVTLSPGANAILELLAERERMDPQIFGSLILEIAIRERHDFAARFSAAARKVLNGS